MLFWDEPRGAYKAEQRLADSCNGQSDSQALFITYSSQAFFVSIKNLVQIISVVIPNCKRLSDCLPHCVHVGVLFLPHFFPEVRMIIFFSCKHPQMEILLFGLSTPLQFCHVRVSEKLRLW